MCIISHVVLYYVQENTKNCAAATSGRLVLRIMTFWQVTEQGVKQGPGGWVKERGDSPAPITSLSHNLSDDVGAKHLTFPG